MKPHFRTFIIKVANRCNINCDYCYVFHRQDRSALRMPVRMELDVARAAAARIREHAMRHGLRHVHVTLHGGEPLLAGPRHVEELLAVFAGAAGGGVRFLFDLQTNGTLVTEQWLDVFERFQVGVGVSLDGPPSANDRHRMTRSRGSTAEEAVRGIALLRSRPALFSGVLAVVDLANDPVEVHDYLAALNPPVIDFNLPHRSHDEPPSRIRREVPEYGEWLSRVYEAWIGRPGHRHTVRMMEDIIALNCGVRGAVESLGLAAPDLVVIESNGAVEDVDTLRSVQEGATQLGLDVFRHSFDDVLGHQKISSRKSGRAGLADQCGRCPVVEICGGGYLPHRYSAARGYDNPSVYCADLKFLIEYILESLRARDWRFESSGAGAT